MDSWPDLHQPVLFSWSYAAVRWSLLYTVFLAFLLSICFTFALYWRHWWQACIDPTIWEFVSILLDNSPAFGILCLLQLASCIHKEHVLMSTKVHGLDYNVLVSDAALLENFEAVVRSAIVAEAASGIANEDVTIHLAPGSVRINAQIALPSGVDPDRVLSRLRSSNLLDNLQNRVRRMPGLQAAASQVPRISSVNVAAPGLPPEPTAELIRLRAPGNAKIKMTIRSARGLSYQSWVCVCRMPEVSATEVRTRSVKAKNPVWNETKDFVGYTVGDPLEFTVFREEKRELVAHCSALMYSDQFFPGGFEGALPMGNSSSSSSRNVGESLVVKLQVLDEERWVKEKIPVGRIMVTIAKAYDLPRADRLGKSDPFCTCEIVGRPTSKVQTRVIKNDCNPTWNHEAEMKGYLVGEWLRFAVWDADLNNEAVLMGRTLLAPEQFYPHGFIGDLTVFAPGKKLRATNASLRVKVLVGYGARPYAHMRPADKAAEEQVVAQADSGQSTSMAHRSVGEPLSTSFVTSAEQAVRLLAEREKALTIFEQESESQHALWENKIWSRAQQLSLTEDAVQAQKARYERSQFDLLVREEEIERRDMLSRADQAFMEQVYELEDQVERRVNEELATRRALEQQQQALIQEEHAVRLRGQQEEMAMESAAALHNSVAKQEAMQRQAEDEFSQERTRLAEWEKSLKAEWRELKQKGGVSQRASHAEEVASWAALATVARVHANADAEELLAEKVIFSGSRYFVACALGRSTDIQGQAFADLASAEGFFQEQVSSSYAAMLMDHDFVEIRYHGPRGRIDDFYTWWQLVQEESTRQDPDLCVEPIDAWARAWRSRGDEDLPLIARMLEWDLSLMVLSNFTDESISMPDLTSMILPFYSALLASHRSILVAGAAHRGTYGVHCNLLVEFLTRSDLLGHSTLQPAELLDIAVSLSAVAGSATLARRRANASSRERNISPELAVVEPCGLLSCRYQFLEMLLRAAHARFVRGGLASSVTQGVDMMLKGALKTQADQCLGEEAVFRHAFFVDEVDDVLQMSKEVLRYIYGLYSNKKVAGSNQKVMSFPAWLCLLRDAGVFKSESELSLKGTRAFGIGVMWQVEDVCINHRARLSYVEFLVALGAIVFMSEHWHADEFADLLETFIGEKLAPVVEERSKYAGFAFELQKEATLDTVEYAYECEALQKDGPLGMEFRVKDGRLFVDRIKPRSWAASMGVMLSDELVRAGSQNVSGLPREAVQEILRKRPVNLVLIRPAQKAVDQDADRRAAVVLQTAWRRRIARHRWEEVLHFASGDAASKALDIIGNIVVEVVADCTHPSLGLSLVGKLPGQVYICGLHHTSWAGALGITSGSRLLAVNCHRLRWMSQSRMVAALRSRPLTLFFACRPWQEPQDAADAPTEAGSTGDGYDAAKRELEKPPEQVEEILERVARKADVELGFTPSGFPPERVLVQDVEPGSWAALNGIVNGDEFYAVNDKPMQDMKKLQVKRTMRSRPLKMSFKRVREVRRPTQGKQSKDATPEQSKSDQAGSKPQHGKAAPYDVDVAGEAIKKTRRGYLLTKVGANIAENLKPGQAPLTPGAFARDKNVREFIANESVKGLGFTVTKWPPEQVCVKSVDEGTWAAINGLTVGDELVAVGNSEIKELTKKDLRDLLAGRPLRLFFSVQQAPVGNPADATTRAEESGAKTGEPAAKAEDPGASAKAEETSLRELTATTRVADLGFDFGDLEKWPPDHLLLAYVEAGSWADVSGLAIGDELVKVGSTLIKDMPAEDFEAALSTRPLKMGFVQQQQEAPGAAQQPASSGSIELIAERDVSDLGFHTRARPPDPIYITAVTPGSWADIRGLVVGQELLEAGQSPLKSMTTLKLEEVLAGRPLRLLFAAKPQEKTETSAHGQPQVEQPEQPEKPNPTGVDVEPQQPSQAGDLGVDIGADEPGAPSSLTNQRRPSVEPATEPQPAPAQPSSVHDATMKEDDLLDFLDQEDYEPPELHENVINELVGHLEKDLDREHVLRFQLIATKADARLGFTPSGLPPAPVLVKKIEPEGLADLNGIRLGDELVAVDGEKIEHMDATVLQNKMRSQRPLLMLFWRVKPGVKKELS